jgi:YMGG-like Gly-zipper
MRQQRCKTSWSGLTILSLPLLVGLIVTPIVAAAAQSSDISIDSAKGQNQARQDQDRYESHSWAVGQARFESSKTVAQAATSGPLPSTAPPSTRYQPSPHHVVRGASRGAALGAVGGAIAGDAGKGAAVGAAMGGLAGGFRRRDERRQQGSLPR